MTALKKGTLKYRRVADRSTTPTTMRLPDS